jgi:hypothetical protein
MNQEQKRHLSVGKTYEIDQRATEFFLAWLPDYWLPRKPDSDFYIDYLLEIVENGEKASTHGTVRFKADNEPCYADPFWKNSAKRPLYNLEFRD